MVTGKGAEIWFQPYYYFLILLQSFVPIKTWADAQYAKHLKVQLLRLKAGVDGLWGAAHGGTQASLTFQQGPLERGSV